MAKSNRITSAASKNKSGNQLDRPFDPAVLKRARAIAQKYQIVVSYEDGEYYGRAVELPDTMNDGKTPAECIENTVDILTSLVAYMLEEGKAPPTPNSVTENRNQQVNVRLSSFERLVLEEAARSRGYRGISDFMRAATLASVR